MGKQITPEQFNEYLSQITPELKEQLEVTIKLCCQKVRSDIQNSMARTERNPDKVYFTNNKKIPHHPSLPGNPPAPDTGNLRNSIRYEMITSDASTVKGIVGTTQKDPPYGTYLEYGTSKGGWGGKGIAPRPWLRPAMRNNSDWIKRNISNAVQKACKGVGK